MSFLTPKKMIWEKKKTCFTADETSRGLEVQVYNKNHEKKWPIIIFFSDGFG